MKTIRVIAIAVLATVAGCGYKHHAEVMRAMADPMFGEWCERNSIIATDCHSVDGNCTSIHFVYRPRPASPARAVVSPERAGGARHSPFNVN